MAKLTAPFPGRVKHYPDEPAYSLLLRTALHNGSAHIHTLFDMVASSEGATLSKLSAPEVARLCKADPLAVSLATAVVTPARVDVLGETFNSEHFSITRRRWCPQCLAKDGYHRVWWDITAIGSCPFHGVELASDCGCGRPLYWQHNPLLLCRRGHDLRRVATRPATCDATAIDRYLVHRILHLDQPPTRFDSLSMRELLPICERVGQVSRSHDFSLMQARRESNAHSLYAEGFRILSDLPKAFGELLDRLYADRDKRPGREGVWKAYGEFYQWVNELPEHALGMEIKTELRRHAEANLKLKAGTVIGGIAVQYDSVTLGEGARRCGLGYARFRDLLKKLEISVSGEGQEARIAISPDDFRQLEAQLKGFKILKQITTELGVDSVTVMELARAGHLSVIAEGKGTADWYFPSDAASSFLAMFWKIASGGPVDTRRHIPIAAAARLAGVSLSQAVEAILVGKAECVCSGELPALEAVFVDAAQLSSAKTVEGVSLSVAAEQLGLRQSGLEAVLAAGLLPLGGPPGHKVVCQFDLDRFKEEYIGLVELRPHINVRNFQLAAKRLQEAGITPVVVGTRLIDHVYRRSALEDFYLAGASDPIQAPERGRNRKEIAKELFMEASMLRQLVEAGLISMQPGCPRGSISDAEVARFQAAYATSSALAKEFGIEGWKTIISHLEHSGIEAICRPPAFEAFLFSRSEAQRAMRTYVDGKQPVIQPDRGPAVTLKEAAAKLGMAYNMATEVARAKILAHHYEGRSIMVTLAEIEKFRDRYVLGNELGIMAGRTDGRGSGKVITNRLIEHGLEPVCRRPVFYSYLFDRADALTVMKQANLLSS